MLHIGKIMIRMLFKIHTETHKTQKNLLYPLKKKQMNNTTRQWAPATFDEFYADYHVAGLDRQMVKVFVIITITVVVSSRWQPTNKTSRIEQAAPRCCWFFGRRQPQKGVYWRATRPRPTPAWFLRVPDDGGGGGGWSGVACNVPLAAHRFAPSRPRQALPSTDVFIYRFRLARGECQKLADVLRREGERKRVTINNEGDRKSAKMN